MATQYQAAPHIGGAPKLETRTGLIGKFLFVLILVCGGIYAASSILGDIRSVHETLALGAFGFLGVALLIALGFEFVNGFHDTANAVATVIYTHSLPPVFAVVWSGVFNFLGVLVSTGAVAYGIITLLPVDLILQVGSAAGYAMMGDLRITAWSGNGMDASVFLPYDTPGVSLRGDFHYSAHLSGHTRRENLR